MIESPVVPDIVGIFARRGGGKTTLLRHLIKDIPRYGIFDPLREYGDLGGVTSKRWLLGVRGYALLRAKTARLVYQPDTGDLEGEFEYIVRAISSHATDGILVCDEIELYTPKALPRESPFRRLVALGRHQRIGIWYATRRPAAISTFLAAQTRHLYIGRQHLPRDLEFFRQAFGEDFDLAELPPYTFLHYDTDTGESEQFKVAGKSS